MVESLPYKQVVTGSSPVATTIIKSQSSGVVAQLVRVSACHAEGRGFESRQLRHLIDPLAQSVEQFPFKEWAVGSNPTRVTTQFYLLLRCGGSSVG